MSDSQPQSQWVEYVENLLRIVRRGPKLQRREAGPRGGRIDQSTLAPVLLFSPHPDDESITGLLPLRLWLEERRPVVNIAVTLGSNKQRRGERAIELQAACQVLGFRCEPLTFLQENPQLLDKPEKKEPGEPDSPLEAVVALLGRFQPALVLFPHGRDGHPTHEAVSRLLSLALARYSKKFAPVLAAETECWQPMHDSNLAVEASPVHVALLCQAIAQHVGEVARNPFHFRQPVRMIENFFRASELIRGFGADCDPISFAELYGLSSFSNGLKKRRPSPFLLTTGHSAGQLFAYS